MTSDPRQSAIQAAIAPELLRRSHAQTLALYSFFGFGLLAVLQFSLYDLVGGPEVFDRTAARASGIANAIAAVLAAGLWVLNRVFERSPRRLVVYRWSIHFGLALVAVLWAVHMHIAGSQSSVVTAVGLGLLAFATWFLPWRRMLAFFGLAITLVLAAMALELTGALPYAPIFVKNDVLTPIFLDGRVVFGNLGIMLFLFGTTVLTLRRFQEQVETSRIAVLQSNRDLNREVRERRRAERALREAQAQLEERVAERTRELAETVESLRTEQRERLRAEEDRERHRERLRQLAAARVKDRERERLAVARQLHDGICQLLVFAQIQTSLLAETQAEDGTRDRFRALIEVLDSAYREARGITTDLRPTVLFELGLEAALHQHIETLQQRMATPIRFTATGPDLELPEERRLTLFQVTRELLANAVKYSEAARIDVTLARSPSEVSVRVADDGVGFDEGCVEPSEETGTGFGLLDVRELVAAAGGTVAIRSQPGRGTEALVTLPRGVS